MNALDPAALDLWGWNESWRNAFRPFEAALAPARVIAQHRGTWVVTGAEGEVAASLTGRFRHTALDGELPAVGDWVACVPSVHAGAGRIDAVLPRRSAFTRRAPGSRLGEQVVAANVDTLFVATSLNRDLNLRRLERYVAMVHESGASPVVVLTKLDLVADADGDAGIASLGRSLGVPVVAVSGVTGEGVETLEPWLAPGSTVALLGSSGVGKSTLLNQIAGTELMVTREIREDDARGRHTTTHRELFRLPSGVLVLDTPGLREIGLWDADDGVDRTFAEIVDLAAGCRFGDCRHEREPGCAVRAAVAAGDLDERRLRGYKRLLKELSDQAPALAREEKRRFSKAVRNISANTLARKSYRYLADD